ncbi:SGS-domain-containing protein [Piedraia hortae CBS 480.64]|uniref:SGS-domain-containing protein n=1 Tax=Piedraia hortae CBS 480.64 TaxID=1314780 RepID=A0A6A7C770_9PEZI|nr:SGS-domain-containing protein [Piedraia hortae CBS 480.64]
MATYLEAGKLALEAKDIPKAIDCFTSAIRAAPTSPEYYIQRSIAYIRAGNSEKALEDADTAVLHARARGKKEAIVNAQYRRACALNTMQRYGDAKFLFDLVNKMNPKFRGLGMVLAQTEAMLNKMPEGDERRKVTIKEIPDKHEEVKEPGKDTSTVAATPQVPAPISQTPLAKIRHDWYQNGGKIYITILARGVPKDVSFSTTAHSVELSFPLESGSHYDFTMDPLFDEIVPDQSEFKVMSTKVEITLVKKTDRKWKSLEGVKEAGEGAEALPQDASNVTKEADKPPMYPTSAKSGPKDWDKVSKNLRKREPEPGEDDNNKAEVEEEEEEDAYEYGGGDAADIFFRKLFKNADPDTKRAMMKSFSESNGTSLSTNWEEVSRKKYDTVPPEGTEVKRFG